MSGAPAMPQTKVYVGGIGNKGKDECENGIRELLQDEVRSTLISFPETGKPRYAVIDCETTEFASHVIKKLNKKQLKGKELAVSFIDAEVDDKPTEYTIGEDNGDGYMEFIRRLRDKLANHSTEFIAENLPVLPELKSRKQPDRWIHIKLSAVKDGETSTTTLVIRDDNLYVKGFRNGDGKWFELCESNEREEEKLPPEHYKRKEALPADWGVSYSSIMGLNGLPQAERTLKSTRLGKAFAERAVRRLSSYKSAAHNNNSNNGDENPTRLGLGGLIVMICEAARMNYFLDTIAGSWNNGMGLTEKHTNLMQKWGRISAALLGWKRSGYSRNKWNAKCGVTDDEAKEEVYLVLNSSIQSGRGAPGNQVEILSVSSNYSPVHSIKVKGDAQNNEGHIIYPPGPKEGKKKRKDGKNDEKESTSNAQDTAKGNERASLISGYEWFDMIFKLRDDVKIERRWDCRKVEGGDATELVSRTIGLESSGDKIEVTYLVMSNAVEANVQVQLRLDDGRNKLENEKDAENSGVIGGSTRSPSGEITAQIGGFEGRPIVLSTGILPLDHRHRFTVYVPNGNKHLQIGLRVTETQQKKHESDEAQLQIDSKSQPKQAPPMLQLFPHQTSPELRPLNFPFTAEKLSPQILAINDNCKAEVHVTWPSSTKPYKPEPDAVFTIGQEFTVFINKVRKAFADQKFELSHEALTYVNLVENDSLGRQQRPSVEDLDGKLFLTRPRPLDQPERWIHIELRVEGVEGLSTTLAVQDGKCYGVGFMNQSQVWYDLGHGNQILPPVYDSVLLGWGLSYKDILGASDWKDVRGMLNRLGTKSFAEKAARTLSRYPDVAEDCMNPRVALAGLILMVCESARFNPLLQYFKDNWDRDTKTIVQLSQNEMDYIWSWGKISRGLLLWRKNGKWPEDDKTSVLKLRGFTGSKLLADVHLVYSDALEIKFNLNTDPVGRDSFTAEEDLEHC